MFSKLIAISVLSATISAVSYELEGCQNTCFRKEISDYEEDEWRVLRTAYAQYERTERYKQRVEAFRELQELNGDKSMLPKARVFLYQVEQDLKNYRRDLCLPFFDYTLYYQNITESPACKRTGIVPEPKPYNPCSVEVLSNLQHSCLREKEEKSPYENFATQMIAYAAKASGVIGTELNLLTLMKTAYEDMAYSNYQIALAVETADNSLQYDCGADKRVRDVLDCRDLCYGYIPHGVKDVKPKVETVDVGNSTTSGNGTVSIVITADPKNYEIRKCPTEYYPKEYAAEESEPEPCACKAYLELYTDASQSELEGYEDTDVDYSILPDDVEEVVLQCQKRDNAVSEQVAAGTFKDEPIQPDYTTNYPYTGTLASIRKDSGASNSMAVGMAAVVILLFALC